MNTPLYCPFPQCTITPTLDAYGTLHCCSHVDIERTSKNGKLTVEFRQVITTRNGIQVWDDGQRTRRWKCPKCGWWSDWQYDCEKCHHDPPDAA